MQAVLQALLNCGRRALPDRQEIVRFPEGIKPDHCTDGENGDRVGKQCPIRHNKSSTSVVRLQDSPDGYHPREEEHDSQSETSVKVLLGNDEMP